MKHVNPVSDDTVTLGAIGVAAYILADAAHEAIGHGGACLATGGRIVMLTSVYFRCSPGNPIAAAAGPGANLSAAGLLWVAHRRYRDHAAHTRLFLLLAFVFNACWGAGQMVYAATLDREDWAFALQGSLPAWLWRPALGVLGGALYYLGLRMLAAGLQSYPAATEHEARRRARRLILVPYFAAGLAACAAAALYRPDPLAAVREAVLETFAANAGLWALARRPGLRATASEPADHITRSLGWIVTTGLAFIAFAAVMGRG